MNLRKAIFESLFVLCIAGISEVSAKDETVRDFLARCARDSSTCSEDVANYLTVFAIEGARYCFRGSSMSEFQRLHPLMKDEMPLIAPVVTWFKAHPETLDMDLVTGGLVKAFGALYACPGLKY
jgi:hypothetical protein